MRGSGGVKEQPPMVVLYRELLGWATNLKYTYVGPYSEKLNGDLDSDPVD